jgi:hypothetical protein
MDASANGSESTPSLEKLLRETREGLLIGVEQIVQRQLDPLLQRIGQVLQEALSATAHHQLEPLVGRLRQTTLDLTEEILHKHAAPLLGQLRAALEGCLDEVFQRRMEPLLEHARQSMQESAKTATQLVDTIVARLRVTVAEPTAERLAVTLPRYARWARRRMVNGVLATTLFCLAAIFLLVGGVLGLQEAGLKPYATYGIGGLTALVGGVVSLRLFMKPLPTGGAACATSWTQELPKQS